MKTYHYMVQLLSRLTYGIDYTVIGVLLIYVDLNIIQIYYRSMV